MTRTLLPVLIALGLASTMSLSGCSLLPRVPHLGSSGGGNSSSDGGGSDGGGAGGGDHPHATLPSGFPSDVPLVGDDYSYALQVSNKAWAVNVRVDNADTAFAKAAQQLNDAGITQNEGIGGSANGVTIGAFQGNGYRIQLNAVAESNDGAQLQYVIVTTG